MFTQMWFGRQGWVRIAAACAITIGMPEVAQAVDVQIPSLVANPDPAIRGGTFTLTATLQNNDSDTAHNVVLSYALPANTQFVSAVDTTIPGACTFDGGSPGNVTCSYATLLGTQAAPAGPIQTVNVTVRTTGATVATVSSTFSATTSDLDVNPANNALTVTTTINAGADLGATMVGAPDPATSGGVVNWTVSGSNGGPNTSGPATYTTTLPGTLAFVAANSGGPGWACSAAGQVVTCNAGALGVGAYPSFVIATRVLGVGSGTVTLNGSLTSSVGDPDLSNNTTVASVSVNPGADLAISQAVPSPSPAVSGSNVTFTLQPSNLGPSAAGTGATVSLPLPAGFGVVSNTGTAGWNCSNAGNPVVVTCSFAGSYTAGAGGTLTITAVAPVVATPTAYNNITATIAANAGGPADPVASNNAAAVNLNVLPDGVDLSITKTKTPAIVALGADMTSTLQVSNAGPLVAAAGTVTLVDTLDPGHEQYVGYSGSNWSCSSAPPLVNCSYSAAIGVGGTSSPLSISTKSLATGAATNSATVSYSGNPGDYNLANNTAGATSSITATANSPDLSVAIGATTAGGVATTLEFNETAINYTATLLNKNIGTGANAQDVAVTLTIPGRLAATTVTMTAVTLTNTSGNSTAAFTCAGTGSGSTGNVVCTQTAGTLLAPGDSVAFTYSSSRPLQDGSYNATVSATSATQGDPTPADNSAGAAVQIDPIADIELVSKVLAGNPVQAGTNATYTITVRNDGPSAAANVALADVFTVAAGDAGFTFISATASDGGACAGLVANQSYGPGSPTLNCSWPASVAAGTSLTVTLVVRPNWQSGAAARTLSNVATASTSTPEDSSGGQGTAPNSKPATLNISPASVDMLISNIDTPDPLGYDAINLSNDDVTYAVNELNNGGPSLATGVGFTFTMSPPAGKTITFRGDSLQSNAASTFPAGNIPGGVCDQTGTSVTGPATLTITCMVPAPGQMAPNANLTRYLVFRIVSAPGAGGDTYNSLATVIVNETDTLPGNNNAAQTTTIRVRSDLAVTKAAPVNPVNVRQPFNWNLTVTNNGPGDSQSTVLTDTLPPGMAFGSGAPSWAIAGGANGNCTTAGQQLTCMLGLLAVNKVATITVPAVMTAYPGGGTAQNCASATTSEVDPNAANSTNVCASVSVQQSSIAGTVFEDRNRVGANGGTPQAAGTEPRIAGVTVALSGTDAYGNAVARSTTTDANGNYQFTGLAPADAAGYTITETRPAGYVNGPVAPPAPVSGSYASANETANPVYSGIALGANTAAANYNFPEVRQPSLSGYVYVDSNLNGVKNAGDVVVPGATVRLLDAGTQAVVATTTTDGAGAYAFTGLDPLIVYTLEVPLPAAPAGLGGGPINPGLIGGAACASGCTAQANTPVAGSGRIATIDLGAGTDGTVFNFGEQQHTAISGLVWLDANRDGVLQAGEATRIAGVTLRLVQGADCGTGTLIQTTSSAADGTYSFSAAVAGQSYLVCETVPAGYGTGSANGTIGSTTITIANLPLAGSQNNNFGPTLSTLSGSVYQDNGAANLYNNGARDAGELGIANVPVSLTGTSAAGAPVGLSTTTDANGNYQFTNLPQPGAGGYQVSKGPIPAASGAFVDGRLTPGTAGGAPVAATVIGTIALPAGTTATGYLFGELPEAPISGTVYIDLNRDSAMQAAPTDGRLAGVTLHLVAGGDCSGTVVASQVTDASGAYSFSGAAIGLTYTVCEATPAGYLNGAANAGGGASSATPTAITIAGLGAAGSAGNNFGLRVGSISGSVYLDANNDGQRQPGENGLPGVVVTLTGVDAAGTAVNRSATTDASGNYRFDGVVAAGAAGYTLTEQAAQPLSGTTKTLNGRTTPGTTHGVATAVSVLPSAITGIGLAAGADSANNVFGEILPVAISGTVFKDDNHNGVQDLPGDAGIAGVTITITGTDDTGAAVSRTVTTDAGGRYAVPDLRPGNYTVTEPDQPAGTTNGLTLAGSAGGSATTPATRPSAVSGIVLTTPGTSATGNNFAELPNNGSIAGVVWQDNNNNGLVDAGEAGIPGVTVTLTGTDASGAAVSRTTSTDASGAYVFATLAPGSYTVTEPAQPAGTLNGITVPGSLGGQATPVSVTPSAISTITLPAGGQGVGYNFGEFGNLPRLWVSKDHAPAAFTVGLPGAYRIHVRNAGAAPTTGSYTITDQLPAGLTLAATPAGSGWTCSGAAGASSFSCSSTAVIAAGALAPEIAATVNVAAAAAAASPLANVVWATGGGEPNGPTPEQLANVGGNPGALPPCDAAISNPICRDSTVVQLAATLSGTVWYDIGNSPGVLDGGDQRLPGWRVQIIDPATNTVVAQTTSGADGTYKFVDLQPGVTYDVRFVDPQSGVAFGLPVNGEQSPGSSGVGCNRGPGAAGGGASSCVSPGPVPQLVVVLAPGQNLTQQSLPVDPSGVVYDATTRQPVPGATVTLSPAGGCAGWNPASAIAGATAGGYQISGNSISMTVGSMGFYQFLFGSNAPAACTFTIAVTPPSGYGFASKAIPPQAGALSPGGGAGAVVAVQPQASPPAGGASTTYYLQLTVGSATASVVNNHIPLDEALPGGLTLTKTGDKAVAEVGDTVRYSVTVHVTSGGLPRQLTVVDQLPPGFTYVAGTAFVNGAAIADPAGAPGPQLRFNLGAMPASGTTLLQYRVRVGVGATAGDGINRAQGYACVAGAGCVGAGGAPLPGSVASNRAQYAVRIAGGVFTDQACVVGKIFVDCNGNQIQDAEELGIPGVRLVFHDGTTLVSDSEGKYSHCGLPPRSAVMRVDTSTLPRGSRLVTSSNRNLGDAGSLWLDLKNGELHRADFIEGSCSNAVLSQVKARRLQGEVRAPETEQGPALRFDSKAHGLSDLTSPREGTDSATQAAPRPRAGEAPPAPPSTTHDDAAAAATGGSHAPR